MNTDKQIAAPKAQNKTAQDLFLNRDLGGGSFGLRRQAERDAALDQAGRLGCPCKSAVAAALCQRSPKAATLFTRLLFLVFIFDNASQGVALGCPVLRLWRGKWRPERPEQESPGQSEAPPWVEWLKELFALKGQNNFHRGVAVAHISPC
jgi:hypothetical protein